MPRIWKLTKHETGKNLIYGWAKGGGPIAFPKTAGVRTGAGAARYIVLEMHLNNPSRTAGRIVRSGVKLYLTSNLREHDVGTIVLVSQIAVLPEPVYY